jgi:hypothetical protein
MTKVLATAYIAPMNHDSKARSTYKRTNEWITKENKEWSNHYQILGDTTRVGKGGLV